MSDNPNCDGDHCSNDTGEVRLYPIGDEPLHGNMILCLACWAHENAFRLDRGHESGHPENWPLRDWDEAKTYPEPE